MHEADAKPEPRSAVEMPGHGKSGKPKAGFPLFPLPLEITPRLPLSHRAGFSFLLQENEYEQIQERTPAPSQTFRLILGLENAVAVFSNTG